MKENKYKITYKNGNTLIVYRYSLILFHDKVYGCKRSFVGGMGTPYICDGSAIEKIDCIEKNNDLDIMLNRVNDDGNI